MFFEVFTPAYRTEIVRSMLKKFSRKFCIYCASFNIQKLAVLENQRVKNTKKAHWCRRESTGGFGSLSRPFQQVPLVFEASRLMSDHGELFLY